MPNSIKKSIMDQKPNKSNLDKEVDHGIKNIISMSNKSKDQKLLILPFKLYMIIFYHKASFL